MRQHFQRYFRLDRLSRTIYLGGKLRGVPGLGLWLAVGLLAAACHSTAPGRVVPVDAAPVSAADVRRWADATVPRESRLHRFKWLYQTAERGKLSSVGGDGAARIAPPDSLRFDAADHFRTHTMAAVVIGDRPLWADPPDSLEKLVPNYPLLWAMFGVVRPPDEGADLRGMHDGQVTAWRTTNGADTVEYRYIGVLGGAGSLTVEARTAGSVVGRVETAIGADSAPRKTRLNVPSVPAKLDITFLSTERKTFAPEIWLRRIP